MKLRWLYLIVAVVLVGSFLFMGSRALKNQNSLSTDDTKSQLTPTNTIQKKALSIKNLIAKNIEKQSGMTERVDFEDRLLEQERFYTEAEIAGMTQENFKSLLKEIELKLPKLSDIKKLPEGALHRTPTPVLEAGRDLGLLKEILKVHESYEILALDFYNQCAKNAERPTPVRALCLTNFVAIKKKNGKKVHLEQYPANLVELTRMITDL